MISVLLTLVNSYVFLGLYLISAGVTGRIIFDQSVFIFTHLAVVTTTLISCFCIYKANKGSESAVNRTAIYLPVFILSFYYFYLISIKI